LEPSFIFGQFVGGLTAAMTLFLIASGLSLIFGVLRVLNFAHGSFYMIGAYLAWQIVQWIGPGGEGFWLAVLGAAAGVAVLGGVIERLLLRHLYRREELYQLLFTYALVLVIADWRSSCGARNSSASRARRVSRAAFSSSARRSRTTICFSFCLGRRSRWASGISSTAPAPAA
jgi:branched-subunit amino acid ABC-type transport system permease component